jgi:hypothetical protein
MYPDGKSVLPFSGSEDTYNSMTHEIVSSCGVRGV